MTSTDPSYGNMRLVRRDDLSDDVPLEREARRYIKYDNTLFYFSPELMALVKDRWRSREERGKALDLFIPPVAGLTFADFEYYVNGTSGYWHADNWLAKKLSERAVTTPESKHIKAPWLYWRLHRIFEQEFQPRLTVTSTYARDFILLNEYLHQEKFTGSLSEWRTNTALWSEDVADRIANYVFCAYANVEGLLKFGDSSTVAAFSHTAKKANKNLLFAQEHEVWRLIPERAAKYRNGKSESHLKRFLGELQTELAGGNDSSTLTPDNLQAFFARRLINAAHETFGSTPKTDDLVKLWAVLKGLTHPWVAKQERDFFTERAKELAPLVEALLVRESLYGSDFDLTVGLTVAVLDPSTWMRGKIDDAYLIMLELVAARTDDEALRLLAAFVLQEPDATLTGKEWREAMKTPDLLKPPVGWFTPVAASGAGGPRAVSDLTKTIRGQLAPSGRL